MQTYAIRRLQAWHSPEEVEAVAARSKEISDSDFPADIRWIRSYVIAEEDGSLGSICIYQASGPEAIRMHAHRVGMPADEITDIADLVVIWPDTTSSQLRATRDRRPTSTPAESDTRSAPTMADFASKADTALDFSRFLTDVAIVADGRAEGCLEEP
jgi:hypothetical protein